MVSKTNLQIIVSLSRRERESRENEALLDFYTMMAPQSLPIYGPHKLYAHCLLVCGHIYIHTHIWLHMKPFIKCVNDLMELYINQPLF